MHTYMQYICVYVFIYIYIYIYIYAIYIYTHIMDMSVHAHMDCTTLLTYVQCSPVSANTEALVCVYTYNHSMYPYKSAQWYTSPAMS